MKKLLYATITLLAFQLTATAQDTIQAATPETEASTEYIQVKPEYPGGIMNFYQYVVDGLKGHKPKKAGKMKISFVVEQDGTISDITILEGLDEKTNKKVVKLFENSPKWTPGKQNGKVVRAQYTLPILFKG
ncbi:MAG: energy transducer TonB [Bacteroidota bacterium]